MPNSRSSVARIYVAAQFLLSDTEKHVTRQLNVDKQEDNLLVDDTG